MRSELKTKTGLVLTKQRSKTDGIIMRVSKQKQDIRKMRENIFRTVNEAHKNRGKKIAGINKILYTYSIQLLI